MRLMVSLEREELSKLQTPIVVEMWGKQREGRIKRAWLKEFTESERALAGLLYKLFYVWYLVKGLPDQHTFKPETLTFIQRLVSFFATV